MLVIDGGWLVVLVLGAAYTSDNIVRAFVWKTQQPSWVQLPNWAQHLLSAFHHGVAKECMYVMLYRYSSLRVILTCLYCHAL